MVNGSISSHASRDFYLDVDVSEAIMRPTPASLARILPRSSVPRKLVRPELRPQPNKANAPTLISKLLEQKRETIRAGQKWPANLRIEEPLTRKDWVGVPRDLRAELKKLVKEK
ncbi:hypothetical protein DACRYDRAFT_105922 [Dacryopinax primogenitus]|uniref:Uncharacterized protein n=1 Tax=Dacryopinax primogenitus (strain DJM 731) TaxID=1858805 RepID=M5GCA9_DACPD|nr:uncharacterized protein DACRYDRAFT_105922 [Dacryopinax primogenitus]EJU03767.1 hypothetical protein DACRYDRAFT_105922 [Dacryopinax primogenitus]